MTAYTSGADRIVDSVVTLCNVSSPDRKMDVSECRALWDTGAVITCISESLVKKLGLSCLGVVETLAAGDRRFPAEMFLVRLSMGEFTLPVLRVLALPMENAGHDVIIGMDVISRGDLAITNHDGKTVLSFRIPSMETIDFAGR